MKSNRDAAGTMGGNVLDMAMVRDGVAKLSDSAGPTPTVTIGSRTYAAGEYPDPGSVTVTIAGVPIDGAISRNGGHYIIVGTIEAGADHARLREAMLRTEAMTLTERGRPDVLVRSLRPERWTAPIAPEDWRRVSVMIEAEAVADKPAGRWVAHHTDPATKARLEAELNATGGCFTAPDEVGSFTIRCAPPPHDPAHTVSLAPPESECIDLSTLSNEDIDRMYGKGSWAAENMKWAKAQPPGEIVAFDVLGERMGAERREPAKPTMTQDASLWLGQTRANHFGDKVLLHDFDPHPFPRYLVAGFKDGNESVSAAALPTVFPFIVEDGGETARVIAARLASAAKPTGNPAPAAGQVWVPELNSARRYTLTREVTRIPERWDTEEGLQILATTLVNQCRYVGTKADCWARAADAMQGAKVTAIHHASLAESYLVGPLDGPRTWTFIAPPADLRSLHDAIGQAIETGTGRVARFNSGPVVVTRDEMLFSPTVTMDASGGLPATVTIAADSKHLRMLRDAVDEARETGKAPPREWGKGRRVAVERVGEPPKVAEQATTEPVRYDGNQGGAQAWRWEVEG